MKKWAILLSAVSMLTLAACGSDDTVTTKEETTKQQKVNKNEGKVLAEADFDKMYSDPNAYKNYKLSFTGKVFSVERDEDGTYLQVYADPKNSEQNTIVGILDPELQIAEDDYVKVTGIVEDEFVGENMMGAEITVPRILADKVEVVDYVTAMAPTLKAIEVNQTQNQYGVQIILEKVEFAKDHTRVYVTVKNGTQEELSFHSYSAKFVVGNQQFEVEDVYEADYPQVSTDILPSIESSGIITFPAIDPNTTAFQFYAESSSNNYDLDWKPFVFKVGQ